MSLLILNSSIFPACFRVFSGPSPLIYVSSCRNNPNALGASRVRVLIGVPNELRVNLKAMLCNRSNPLQDVMRVKYRKPPTALPSRLNRFVDQIPPSPLTPWGGACVKRDLGSTDL